MAYWHEVRFKQRSGDVLASMRQAISSPRYRDPALQWAVVVGVGSVLGAYTIVLGRLPSKWAALSALVIVAPFVAMIVGQVRRLLLAAIAIDIPLQLDSFFAYREGAIGGSVPGLIVSITTLCLAALYVLWLAELLAGPSRIELSSLLRASLPLILYIGIGAASITVATDIELSSFKLFLLVQMFLVYIYIVGTVNTRKDVLFVATMLLIGLVLESAIMIGLRAIGHSIEIGGVLNARVDDGVRVGGTIGGPNTASGYISLLLTSALGLLLAHVRRFHKALATLAFGLGVIALFLTLSRAGWIASGVSIVMFCFFVWRRGWMPMVLPVIIAAVGVLLTVLFGNEIVGRLFGTDDGSAASRIPLMTVALKMIVANPFLGVGINNFTVVFFQYADLEQAGIWLYAVHNKYLLVWSEIGTAGFLTFVWFLLVTIRRGWQSWMFKDRLLSLLALGFTTAIMGHMIQLNFDTFQNRASVQTLWVAAALITAINNLGSNDIPTNRKNPLE